MTPIWHTIIFNTKDVDDRKYGIFSTKENARKWHDTFPDHYAAIISQHFVDEPCVGTAAVQ